MNRIKIIILICFLGLSFQSDAQISRTFKRLYQRLFQNTTGETLPITTDLQAFYVSSSTGSDSNPGTILAPFASITKLNTKALTDTVKVYFKRGDTFSGTITVPNSGTSGTPVVYDAYGSGADPLISGFTTVTGFTKRSNTDVYVKYVPASITPAILTVNGVQYAMGRTPNSDRYNPEYDDYFHIDSYSGTTQITDTEIPATTANWTGAEAVIRTANHMNWARCPITNHASNTITFTNSLAIANSYGYFIQNDLRTLDQFGEWYFNPTTDSLYFYGNPTGYTIKISTLPTLLDVNTRDYVTVKNISFEGANENAIETNTSSLAYNLTIDNCDFDFNNRAIYGHTAPEMTIANCSITNSAYMAIYNHYWSEGAHIYNNTIDSTGLVIGGWNVTEGSFLSGIALYSAYGRHLYSDLNTIIEDNTILNTGYMGMFIGSDSAIIRDNYVNRFNVNKSDGGAIYTGIPDSIYVGMLIDNNVCLNGLESDDLLGLPQNNVVNASYIIYLDNTTDGGTTVSDNTMAHTKGAGLMVHMSKNVTITGNTIFDCTTGVKFQELSGYDTPDIENITMNNNKIISKTSPQKVISVRSLTNDFSTWGDIDENYYAKPTDGDPDFISMVNTFVETVRDSASWRTYTSQDANSTFNDIQIQDDDSIRFYTNPTNVAVIYALSDTLIDVEGTKYNTSVTVSAHGSVVLWNDDTPTYTPKLIGIQTVGGSAFSSSIRQAMPITMTENGTITAIVMYMGSNTTTNARLILGLYTNSGGLPATKLGETDDTEQLTYAGWERINLKEPVAVTSGTTYWLAWVFENATQAYYTAGTPGRANTTGTTFADGMPSSFGSSTTASSVYSIYAIYK